MSDHHGPTKTSVHQAAEQGMAKFITLYLEGRIKFIEKLNAAIAVETDPEKLQLLRKELNDSFITEDEIVIWESKTTKLLTAVDKISDIILKIRTKMRVQGEEKKPEPHHH